MISFVPMFLQNAPAAGQVGGGMSGMITFLPLILILLIMYFLMIRPQNKKQKETQKMIEALKKGDKVVTIGGIHGTVASTKENTVIIKVDDSTRIEFNRTAIATVIVDKPATAVEPEKEKKGLFGKKSKDDSIVAEIKDKDEEKYSDSEADKDE